MVLIAANDNDTMVPLWVVGRQFFDHLKRIREAKAADDRS